VFPDPERDAPASGNQPARSRDRAESAALKRARELAGAGAAVELRRVHSLVWAGDDFCARLGAAPQGGWRFVFAAGGLEYVVRANGDGSVVQDCPQERAAPLTSQHDDPRLNFMVDYPAGWVLTTPPPDPRGLPGMQVASPDSANSFAVLALPQLSGADRSGAARAAASEWRTWLAKQLGPGVTFEEDELSDGALFMRYEARPPDGTAYRATSVFFVATNGLLFQAQQQAPLDDSSADPAFERFLLSFVGC
jgi:hypothetical protein